MRALQWRGPNRLAVGEVPDPAIKTRADVVVRVRLSATCGSDLQLLGGDSPYVGKGDVLGHEFVGEVVELGADVQRHHVGDRVVVAPVIACGRCWFCSQYEYSLCDNGGCFGWSHAGSHAEYVRVPFADVGAFTVPDEVADERALFASDAASTGWMGADMGGVNPGDVVAVWGAGAVGQLAARAAQLLGADRVLVIDRYDNRLRQVEKHIGAETINYERTDVVATLLDRSGGRGPDVCLEAVGRPGTVGEAVTACRKGGSVFVLGLFAGLVDRFPLGAISVKGLTVRSARMHGQRYIPMLLQRMAKGELTTEHLATHVMPLEEAPEGYRLFRTREDGCVRAVFRPGS
ncbi:alcohol dehydrogenase catalytic domain-containing protein [Actinoplanes sp. TRM 88003]|uniref:Alcohol dehydrogenase catalytic domain-containing protein n=1 Tax=Paractinoplanes aksuensis TaxID=2939490 RepID=A0ABT1E423_9ACTN|nr:alcohol dehydrogenase catalytic domain-containing protein [Actinoplanes aksuensis]MCO8276880.1 alcohol dehydrogenase catalytic domain-containing protein [Actinoplanes aksuensis]